MAKKQTEAEKQISNAAAVLGRAGYKRKLAKLGLEAIQEHAREVGKLGGRPKGSKSKKGAKTK